MNFAKIIGAWAILGGFLSNTVFFTMVLHLQNDGEGKSLDD
jgi:hypothetical protein